MRLFKEDKVNRKNLKLRIVILMLIAILSNYFMILSEFTGIVLATNELSSFIDYVNESVDNTTEEQNEEIYEEEESETLNEIFEEDVTEEVQEVQPEENKEVETKEEQNEEPTEKMMTSSLEILKAYKTAKGVAVEVKIINDISNVKAGLDMQKVTLQAPNLEGYAVIGTYLNHVELYDENLFYDSTINDNEVIIEIFENLENSENELAQFLTNDEVETEKTEEISNVTREYTVLYVFEGVEEIGEISIVEKEELVYAKETITLDAEVKSELTVEDREENEYTVSAQNSSIYKGNLYANAISTLGYETNYSSIDNLYINSIDNIDFIMITEKPDRIITKFGEEIVLENCTKYNKTSISIQEFKNIFGEDGYIEILSNGNALGRIDKNAYIEDDCYVFEYPENISNVEFSLNNMVNIGSLSILNNKTILSQTAFNRLQIINFKSVETEVISQEFAREGENLILLSESTNMLAINLEDTESKIDFDMTTEDLITTEINMVTMNVTLKTNEEKYELFQNPVIDIELPTAVETVDVKNINLMYKNGLSIANWEVIETESNSKVIRIRLDGIQNEYKSDGTIGGTTVIINTELGLNRITANGKGTIKVRYTNDAGTNISYLKEGKDSDNYEVNYVSKSGILKEVKIENFDDENTVLVGNEDGSIIGTIPHNNIAKIAKVSAVFMNNYNNDIGNVQIVGKIPFVGNTKDGINLNTTVDAKLNGPVSLNGLVAKVYYSTEENPDIEYGEWLEESENWNDVKVFKVVVENESIKPGEKIEFSYDINIPENLGYNAHIYNLITAYYDFNEERIGDSSIIGLKTEERALELDDCQTIEESEKITVGTNVTRGGISVKEGEEINERQILKYTVVVVNNSNEEIKNLKIRGNAENANSYYWYTYEIHSSTDGSLVTTGEMKEDTENKYPYQEKTVNSLLPGEKIIYTYEVKVKKLSNIENNNVQGKILISADGIDEQEYKTVKNPIRKAKVDLLVKKYGLENVDEMFVYSTDDYIIETKVTNITNETLENVEVNIMLPPILKHGKWDHLYTPADITITEQEMSEGTMITAVVPTLEKGETRGISISTEVGNLPLDVAEKDVTVVAHSTIDEIFHISNDYTRAITQTESYINLSYTSNVPSESKVKNGDEITYTIIFENTGFAEKLITLMDNFDYGLVFSSAKMYLPDGTEKDIELHNGYLYIREYVKSGEKLKLEINCVIDENELRSYQTEIINDIDISPKSNIDKIEDIIYYIDNNQTNSSDDENQKPVIGNEENEEEYKDNGVPDEEIKEPENENQEDEKTKEEVEIEKPNTEAPKTEENNENTNQEIPENKEENNNEKQEEVENTNNNQEKPKEEKEQNTTIPVSSAKYAISGKVWIDENEDGINSNEDNLSGITAMLYKIDGADVRSIDDSKLCKRTTTDSNGSYRFNSLDKGKYVVVFEYDNEKYDITSYQVNGKKDTNLSSVIEKELTLNNIKKKYAVSDILEITDKSIININAGLKEKAEFDMQIDTYISSVTVTNKNGTVTEKFDIEDRLAKVEIHSKYIEGSIVKVNYIVKITNNGQIEGYINQISNFMPNGFDIDKSTVSVWSVGSDGTLYNSSLSKNGVKPGESKTFSIVLTKQMTGEETGTYKNTAKIEDSTNKLQLKDNNKENDVSTVELLISVKTGAVYYILVLIIVLTIAFIAMLIISRQLQSNKEKRNLINKFIIVISLFIIIILCSIIKIYALESSELVSIDTLIDLPNINDYFNAKVVVGQEYKNGKLVSKDRYSMVQCIHYGNVAGVVSEVSGARTLVSDVQISGGSYATKYITSTKIEKSLYGNADTSGNSVAAGQMSYIGCYLEDYYQKGGPTSYDTLNSTNFYKDYHSYPYPLNVVAEVLEEDSAVSEVENMMKINVLGKFNSKNGPNLGDYEDDFYGDALEYGKAVLNSNVTEVSPADAPEKLTYYTQFDGYGQIYLNIPTESVLKPNVVLQYSEDNTNWTEIKTVIMSDASGNPTEVTFSGSACDGKIFYIPSSAIPDDVNFDKLKIRVHATVSAKKARIMAFFHQGSEGQGQILTRATDANATSSVEYPVDGKKYKASINKYLVNVNGTSIGTSYRTTSTDGMTTKKVADVYADKGNTVIFKINVKNTGTNTTLKNVKIKDTADSGLTFLGFCQVDQSTYQTADGATSGKWTRNGDEYSYSAVFAQGDVSSIYVKYRVDKAISANNEKLENKVYISHIDNENSQDLYVRTSYTGQPTTNEMDEGGVYTSSDYIYTNTYDINITKDASGTIFEVGDNVVYTIKVSNPANGTKHYGNIDNIVVEDLIPSGLEFVSYTGTGWTRDANTNKYSYSNSLAPNGSANDLKITMKVTNSVLKNTTTTITNTATIVDADTPCDEDVPTIPKSDDAIITIKGYKLSIEKVVSSIETESGNVVSTKTEGGIVKSAEIGDIITYKITLKNNSGTESDNYGEIKYVIEEDIPAGFEYVADSSWAWTANSGKYSYSGTLNSGATSDIYIKMRVPESLRTQLKDTYLDKTNTVTVISAKNKNNIDILTDTIVTPKLDTAIVRVKGYSMSLDKRIVSVKTKDGVDTGDTSIAEIGDIITFEIEITNEGDNSTDFGDIKGISFIDTFNNGQLAYYGTQNYGSGWSLSGNVFTYNGTLTPGTSTKVTLVMEVILETTEEAKIYNTATLNTVTNKNGISLIEIFPLEDTVELEIQTYDIAVNKYITLRTSTEDGTQSITERENLTNTEKYNSPVEVEKTDRVVYTLEMGNMGTTILNNITLVDTLESGIQFIENVGMRRVDSAGRITTLSSTDLTESISGNVITYNYPGELNAGETIYIDIECEVIMTNMYLLNLKNTLEITTVYNRNDYELISTGLAEFIENNYEEYIRLKNLKIEGTVWLDINKDGLIDDTEEKLEGIEVRLHDNTNKKFAVTYTDDNGHYIFNETTGTKDNGSADFKEMVEGGDNRGRVIKATGRDDATGNYSTSSQYITYYIEFYYNGVKYTSSTYHGKNNLQTNNTFSPEYMIDSNAQEYEDEREEFNQNLEIIAFNRGINGINGNEIELQFEKDGHISTLSSESGAAMSAYSFVVDGTTYNTGLVNGSNIDMLFFDATGDVETEYLKYIDLGLIEREKVDLRTSKDLLYAQFSIKGTDLDYNYEQVGDDELYCHGTPENEIPYNIYIYRSDYYYRHEMYKNQAVRDVMGEDSELDIQLVYRIRVTNESTDPSFIKVNEVIDHYTDEMTIVSGSVYMIKEGTNEKVSLITSNISNYNDTSIYNLDGYTTTFITGMDKDNSGNNLVLTNGESLNIYITYNVDTFDDSAVTGIDDLIYMDEKINVAQIGAYSTYIDASCDITNGLVDEDSNAGNINNTANGVGIEETDLYDDNAFRIIADMKFKDEGAPGEPTEPGEPGPGDPTPGIPDTKERRVSGYVFEDVRSELVSEADEAGTTSPAEGFNEFVGNGTYNSSDERHIALKNLFIENGMKRLVTDEGDSGIVLQDLDNDTKLEGMTVQLIEIVKIDTDGDGIEEIYEESIDYSNVEESIDFNFANVQVQTDTNGKYYIESFTPGSYFVRFKYGDMYVDGKITQNSLIHNGQDYRSTVYTLTDDAGNLIEENMDVTVKYEKLKQEGISDARDNEYRRLEVMSASETITNDIAEFMKASSYDSNDNDDTNDLNDESFEFKNYDDNNVTEELKKFSETTEAFADTVSVTFGIEDTEYIVMSGSLEQHFTPVGAIGNSLERSSNGYIPFDKIENLIVELPNIDFGLSYRPENYIKLTKKISSIKIETSTGNVLVDLQYEYDENLNATLVKKDGAKNVQSIDTIGNIQGFRYVNIDEDLMQGAKVSIGYKIFADNIGEVETINTRLWDKGGSLEVYKTLEAKSDVLNSTLAQADENGSVVAVNYSRMNELMKAAYGVDYDYGSFVGAIYYKGRDITATEVGELKIVPVKVERILDWVDNDATFETANNSTTNRFWTATTEAELIERGLIDERELDVEIVDADTTISYYKDERERKYTTDNRKNIALNVDTEEENPDLIKDIYPVYAEIDSYDTQATISIQINDILSSGTENDQDMAYDNVAEVAQFETVVGRRTNFASTVGNIHLTENGGTPFGAALSEIDTAGTEIVALTPPTGLTRFRLFMAYNIRIMTTIMIIVVIAILAFLTKKYVIGRKKFYK